MKKIITISCALILAITLTGCSTKKTVETDAKKFKSEYESLNGKTNSSGKEHRTVSIPEDNPFVYTSASDIVEKIENGETFYVYFGSKLCPWCRSVIEKSIEVAKKKGIETIYYVDVWDDEGNEILRDKYTVENGEAKKIKDGTKDYYKLLDLFDSVLGDYTLSDEDGNEISTDEKRIYAPTFIYIKDGKVTRTTDGTSENQKDSREDFTDEILKDEEELFNKFFVKKIEGACSVSSAC